MIEKQTLETKMREKSLKKDKNKHKQIVENLPETKLKKNSRKKTKVKNF